MWVSQALDVYCCVLSWCMLFVVKKRVQFQLSSGLFVLNRLHCATLCLLQLISMCYVPCDMDFKSISKGFQEDFKWILILLLSQLIWMCCHGATAHSHLCPTIVTNTFIAVGKHTFSPMSFTFFWSCSNPMTGNIKILGFSHTIFASHSTSLGIGVCKHTMIPALQISL